MQHLRCRENLRERWLPVLGDTMRIMQVLRPIDAQTHQEIVALEELSPLIVQESTVCLQVVFDTLVRLLVLLPKLNNFAKEIQAQQCRLAALPREDNRVPVLALDILLDVRFKNLVGDADLAFAA